MENRQVRDCRAPFMPILRVLAMTKLLIFRLFTKLSRLADNKSLKINVLRIKRMLPDAQTENFLQEILNLQSSFFN